MYQIDYISVWKCVLKKPSQREYNYRRLYDYAIKFRKDIILSEPTKVYLLFLAEINALDR